MFVQKLGEAQWSSSPHLAQSQTQSSFMVPVFAQLIRTFLASDAELLTTVHKIDICSSSLLTRGLYLFNLGLGFVKISTYTYTQYLNTQV